MSQAGHRVGDQQPAEVERAEGDGEETRHHTGGRQCCGEQPVGQRPLLVGGQVRDERLAGWFVELEGETEHDHADQGQGERRARRHPQLGTGAADQAEADGRHPSESVGQPATGEPGGDRGEPERCHHPACCRHRGTEPIDEHDGQERQREGPEPVDGAGERQGPDGAREVAPTHGYD